MLQCLAENLIPKKQLCVCSNVKDKPNHLNYHLMSCPFPTTLCTPFPSQTYGAWCTYNLNEKTLDTNN